MAGSNSTHSIIPEESATNLIYNPLADVTTINDPLADIDPDSNFLNLELASFRNNSKFYTEASFKNEAFHSKTKSTLSLVHTNIRSIPKNLEKFEYLLHDLDWQFDIIGVTEAWLKDHNKCLYSLENYNSEHLIRPKKKGGGVSIFLREHIGYKLREDLTKISEESEMLFIEIDKDTIKARKNILIGLIYRPPGTNINTFNETMVEIHGKIKNENKKIYLMGDFNINLLNESTHAPTKEFLDNMISHSFYPVITRPTRITSETATIIDNIFTNNMGNEIYAKGSILVEISDHLPIFIIEENRSIETINHTNEKLKRKITEK